MRTSSLLLLLAACGPADPLLATGPFARVVGPGEPLPGGEDVLAQPGDVILGNDHLAMVLQSIDEPRTWYSYGGIPIDLWPREGGVAAGPDRFYEMGWIVGHLDAADFNASSLRMFRGQSINIVNDGTDGGAAVVEVHGTDDRFWLVELDLIKQAFLSGSPRPPDANWGLDLTTRYTVEPDASAVRIDLIAASDHPQDHGFLLGAFVIASDRARPSSYVDSQVSFAGFGLNVGLPWLHMGRTGTSYALAMPGAALARVDVGGTTNLIDLNQALQPPTVGPGSDASSSFVLGVSAIDAAGAAGALQSLHPAPSPGLYDGDLAVSGTVTDPSGEAVPGAMVHIERQDAEGGWQDWTTLATDASGAWSGEVPWLGANPMRVLATHPARDPSPPSDLVAESPTALQLSGAGTLAVDATDGEGAPITVRLELQRDDGQLRVLYPSPTDPDVQLPAGHWTFWASRGYEHDLVSASVDIADGQTTTLPLQLPRLVDTHGWASLDTHVHAEASPDSSTLNADRARTVSASGLDAAVITDHEAITHYDPAEAGIDDVLLIAGSEVTATLPEHTNAWPFPLQPGKRGNWVDWRGHSLGAIYAAERVRGAQVVQLNHPRVNGECGILCVLDWDRLTGEPRLTDPTLIALPADEPLWSWDFDAVEVLNGLREPFVHEGDPRHTGAFDDWMAFLNLGHIIAPFGVTDVHGADIPGSPRTYIQVGDDRHLSEEALVDGTLRAATQISAGAFASLSAGGSNAIGRLVPAAGGLLTLTLTVQALPQIDVAWIEVLVNCDGATDLPTTDPDALVKLDTTIELQLTQDAHVEIVGFGTLAMPRGLESYDPVVPRFITAAALIDVDGNGRYDAPGGKACSWDRGLALRP